MRLVFVTNVVNSISDDTMEIRCDFYIPTCIEAGHGEDDRLLNPDVGIFLGVEFTLRSIVLVH